MTSRPTHAPHICCAGRCSWVLAKIIHTSQGFSSHPLCPYLCPRVLRHLHFHRNSLERGHLELARSHAEDGACGGDVGRDWEKRGGMRLSEPRTVQRRVKAATGRPKGQGIREQRWGREARLRVGGGDPRRAAWTESPRRKQQGSLARPLRGTDGRLAAF